MRSILIDFESTGLDTSKDRIIEIGAQLVDEGWNVERGLSLLVKPEGGPISSEITDITGITQSQLELEGLSLPEAALKLGEFANAPDIGYVIAYNSAFDEPLFRTEMARHQLSLMPGIANLIQAPWLCAMTDVAQNYKHKCWKLSHLAIEHGVAVDPKDLHRAVADVNLMRQVLAEIGTTAKDLFTYRNTPWMYIRAMIPKPWEDNGKGRDEAKKLGYSWEVARGTDGPKFDTAWVKRIKQTQFDAEVLAATFKIRQLQPK